LSGADPENSERMAEEIGARAPPPPPPNENFMFMEMLLQVVVGELFKLTESSHCIHTSFKDNWK